MVSFANVIKFILDQFVVAFAMLDAFQPFGDQSHFSLLDLILTLLLVSVLVCTFIPVARK